MWVYKNKPIATHEDLLPECTDFVYILKYTNGQKYIGKKTIRSKRKKPPLKGKKRCRRIMTNLPFAKYEGSHGKKLGLEIETKEILYQCSTKKAATFIEAALLFSNDALTDSTFINENISGKYFSTDLAGLLEE